MKSRQAAKPTWETISDSKASQLVTECAARASGCGCGWYDFKGRCGHLTKRQTFFCGRNHEDDEATFCRNVLNREGLPRIIEMDKYRLDDVCQDCRRHMRTGEASTTNPTPQGRSPSSGLQSRPSAPFQGRSSSSGVQSTPVAPPLRQTKLPALFARAKPKGSAADVVPASSAWERSPRQRGA